MQIKKVGISAETLGEPTEYRSSDFRSLATAKNALPLSLRPKRPVVQLHLYCIKFKYSCQPGKIKKDDVSFKSKSEVENDNNLLGETSSTNSISQYMATVN